ncbi:hypothetical protein P872_17040 [Rhodonellum psychrophilum GCM71 = DSM 17998]|uniref:Uncharacterized protein n=2 Tax=Rhodonellum TaxID=336827 RepID=U5C090_9BACT|nr:MULTISPECIES: rhamnogalacturonan acetylesterase [Rhodonellum]ERM83229.1 hypothetical protein P872_17040 [Rhodonellum psychrophilum GCM71 = DSM 17998]SDZ13878.1 Lysophospholipase L1 [Rhodonellum ikkaensis]
MKRVLKRYGPIFKALIFLWYFLPQITLAQEGNQKTEWKFDFGTGEVQAGYEAVQPWDIYAAEKGFGFLGGTDLIGIENLEGDPLVIDGVSSLDPFYFLVDLPEGNYDVTVYLGDLQGKSATTIRAECRRLMLEETETAYGEIKALTFTVNIRQPEIGNTGERVKLKERELDYLHWDDKLTIEFNGENPRVTGLEIQLNTRAVTVFLAGNSTVVDQAYEPWAAWGQMFPVFFQAGKVAIANHAESGESLLSFQRENRLDKILDLMRPGDYLFVEFGHNDQKTGGNHLDAFTTYKETLKSYIASARQKGGIPVLVTSMHRRSFDQNGKIVNTLGDYPEAVRQVAHEENVALIDLNAMSKVLYESWGPEYSKKAFVHFAKGTFEGQEEDFADNTHFSTYGANELAKAVVEGLKNTDLEVIKFLKPGIVPYDPEIPGRFEDFYWPLSKRTSNVKPDGN